MNIFKKIKEQIFNSDVHIRKRLFVLSVAITLIALMVIFIEIMLTDENIWDGILLGTGILITGIIAWLAVKYNKITFAGICSRRGGPDLCSLQEENCLFFNVHGLLKLN